MRPASTLAALFCALAALASAPSQAAKCPDVSDKIAKATKPAAYDSRAMCTGSRCAAICEGGKVKMEAFNAALKKARAPRDMIDPACALLKELPKLDPTCKPDPKKSPGRALESCGILFSKDADMVPGAVPGLAKAAMLAKKAGKVLVIGSTYRSHLLQASYICREINLGHATDSDPPCGGKTRRACPGDSPHASGYAADLYLASAGPKRKSLTPGTGEKAPCADHIRFANGELKMKRLRHDPKDQRELIDIMYEAGWSWFCGELWHFEYTDKPVDKTRVNSRAGEEAITGAVQAKQRQRASKKQR